MTPTAKGRTGSENPAADGGKDTGAGATRASKKVATKTADTTTAATRRRRPRLTRQTRLALASAGAFVVLALLLAVLPVPYVIYSKGRAYDVYSTNDGHPMLEVQGITTYPTTGRLEMTTVSVTRPDASASLPEALVAYALPRRDALPRDSVYENGKSNEQVHSEGLQMMDNSQHSAVVAGLRAANQPVSEVPAVSAVSTAGPSNGKLRPGDLIVAVDGRNVSTITDVQSQIARHLPGDVLKLQVLRDGVDQRPEITLSPSNADPRRPVLGIELGVGYRYQPQVKFGVGEEIGGPSAGLVFALALYDEITPGDLLKDRVVAGTGTIEANGTVGPIGGIQQKISAAEDSGAQVFLVPAGNCADLTGMKQTDMELVRVQSLDDAIEGLRLLQDPTNLNRVPRCQ